MHVCNFALNKSYVYILKLKKGQYYGHNIRSLFLLRSNSHYYDFCLNKLLITAY